MRYTPGMLSWFKTPPTPPTTHATQTDVQTDVIPWRANRRYAGIHRGFNFDIDDTCRRCEITFDCQDDIYVKFTGLVSVCGEPLRCEILLIEENHGVQIERRHTVTLARTRGWVDYGEFVTLPKSRVFHITCGEVQPEDKIKVYVSGRLN